MGKQSDIQEQQGKGDTRKSNKPLIIIFIIVIAALLGVIAWLLFFRGTEEETDDRLILINDDNKDTVMDELDDKVAKGMFECKMSMTWNFTGGGQGSSDAYVANSEHNTYAIYFDVIDNTTNETLYSSPYIVVGSEMWREMKSEFERRRSILLENYVYDKIKWIESFDPTISGKE